MHARQMVGLLLALVLGVAAARAEGPARTLSFQGRLTAASGAALPDGARTVTLRLYDAATGGAPLWEETKQVALHEGLFATALGDTNPLPAGLAFDRAYYVGVRVGDDAEMAPRLPLSPAPSVLSETSVTAGLGSPLKSLALPHAGTAMQAGSRDPTGGNADFRTVDPGQTITLFEHTGAGEVERFWCTIMPRSTEDIHSQAILRMYWDGETTPSVEAPIGAFFGIGFGQQVDYQSMPLNETSGGYNCYWPMPFHKSARWTLTNMSNRRIDAFYWNIDYTARESLPANLRHFHAQWRRENPTTSGRNYTILEATGEGHFAGTALFMQNRVGTDLGFLEGDEMMYIDGAETPSISGTGTEDYFSSGWYYDRGPYSALYHGVPIKDTEKGRISTYRWHIEDAKPFTKSIRVTIEHGTNNDRIADYSSVAYWYQTEPHAPFPAFPTDPKDLLPWTPQAPFSYPNAIEGEALVPTAQVTDGDMSAQDMTQWGNYWSSGSQLWWRPAGAGSRITLHLPAATAGMYDVTAYCTKAPDYGEIQFYRGTATIGPRVNLYDENVVPSGAVYLGRLSLVAGDNQFSIAVMGKDNRSVGTMVGVDAFTLSPS